MTKKKNNGLWWFPYMWLLVLAGCIWFQGGLLMGILTFIIVFCIYAVILLIYASVFTKEGRESWLEEKDASVRNIRGLNYSDDPDDDDSDNEDFDDDDFDDDEFDDENFDDDDFDSDQHESFRDAAKKGLAMGIGFGIGQSITGGGS